MTTDKPSRNEDEYFTLREQELLREQRQRLEAERLEAERRTHYMKCPKDGHDLVSRDDHGVQVEQCPHCGGLWLDPGELEALSRQQDHPGLLGRVIRDALNSLRGTPPRDAGAARPEPGNPPA